MRDWLRLAGPVPNPGPIASIGQGAKSGKAMENNQKPKTRLEENALYRSCGIDWKDATRCAHTQTSLDPFDSRVAGRIGENGQAVDYWLGWPIGLEPVANPWETYWGNPGGPDASGRYWKVAQ